MPHLHIFIHEHHHYCLIAQRSELLERRCGISNRLLAEFKGSTLQGSYEHLFRCGLLSTQETNLAFEVGLRLDLPLLFKAIHNILVSPANLVRQAL